MSKFWIYNHFNPVTKKIAKGEDFKQTIFLQEDQPGLDYSEVTDILTFNAIDIGKDYNYKKKMMESMSDYENNWGSLSVQEKDLLIDNHIYPQDTDAVFHLMSTKGMSQVDAIDYIRTKYAEMIVKDAESCKARSKSAELTKVVITYLNGDEATDFLRVTEKLNDLFMNRAIKGLNDGSYRAGLFDFIEDTNDYDIAGLEHQGYTLISGTWLEFKSELMDILRHGNYAN